MKVTRGIVAVLGASILVLSTNVSLTLWSGIWMVIGAGMAGYGLGDDTP